jgi:MFS family permease
MASYEKDFGYTDTTTVSAVMVSLQNVGAFLAALSIFTISERYGRRKTIMVACTVFCVGVILQVVPSHSLVCFYIGRMCSLGLNLAARRDLILVTGFIAGLGLGSATAVAPGYNAEMAPKEIRGQLGSGVQWLFALGVMISYWVRVLSPSLRWNYTNYIPIVDRLRRCNRPP